MPPLALANRPLSLREARPSGSGSGFFADSEADATPPVLDWRMKFLLLCVGLLLLTLGSGAFFVLLMRGSESILVYPAAASMYLGLGLTVYALMMWTDRED